MNQYKIARLVSGYVVSEADLSKGPNGKQWAFSTFGGAAAFLNDVLVSDHDVAQAEIRMDYRV